LTDETEATQPGGMSRLATWAGWLLAVVPLVGVLELLLHLKQIKGDIVPSTDWVTARELIEADLQPDDLILFEPFWADPLGRLSFGDLASVKREARSDERRFRRAYEVSLRGAHNPAIASWRELKTQRAGGITVTLRENPAFTPVLDDLLDFVAIDRVTVSRVDGTAEQPCSFQRGSTHGGSTVVPQGLLTPAEKFVCAGGHVGVAVLHDLNHRPRLCIYATPMQGASVRMRFSNVTFGTSVHGHSGIQWVDERTPADDKVSLSFSAFERPLGTHLHQVGKGWIGFEFPTSELDGKRGDLLVELAPSGHRQFCFEATTRREVSP
jgi:hypothetical protein